MKFSHTLTYTATAAQVYTMLIDPDFRAEVVSALDANDGEVATGESDEVFELEVRQSRATAGLPGFAQKFVGDEIEIVQNEVWTSPTHADLTITIPGKPGQLVGGINLVEADGVTTESITGDLTVSIPFVGAKLESMIAGLLSSSLKVEGRVGTQWLNGELSAAADEG